MLAGEALISVLFDAGALAGVPEGQPILLNSFSPLFRQDWLALFAHQSASPVIAAVLCSPESREPGRGAPVRHLRTIFDVVRGRDWFDGGGRLPRDLWGRGGRLCCNGSEDASLLVASLLEEVLQAVELAQPRSSPVANLEWRADAFLLYRHGNGHG